MGDLSLQKSRTMSRRLKFQKIQSPLFPSDQFGDGEQKRDFIYVKDAARMTCAFLQNDASGVFNIGTGHAGTWNEVARSIFKALKMKENIQYVDMPADLIGKYQNYTCASMAKTTEALGKAAVCKPLGDTVVEYVTDYLAKGRTW